MLLSFSLQFDPFYNNYLSLEGNETKIRNKYKSIYLSSQRWLDLFAKHLLSPELDIKRVKDSTDQ